MYCSSCGSAVPGSLSYCNRCGAKVSGAELGEVARPTELPPAALLTAILVVFVFGLAAVFGLMALATRTGGPDPIIIAAAMLSFVLTFLIEVMLFWMLLRGRRHAAGAGAAGRPKGQTTRELEEAQARLLPEPLPSVTEHTTRTFDPAYSERKSK